MTRTLKDEVENLDKKIKELHKKIYNARVWIQIEILCLFIIIIFSLMLLLA